MSPRVKTKRQANFKDFKRFGAFKGLVEQKKKRIQLVRVSIGLFWHSSNKLLFSSSAYQHGEANNLHLSIINYWINQGLGKKYIEIYCFY
jgi:hypothetical protein